MTNVSAARASVIPTRGGSVHNGVAYLAAASDAVLSVTGIVTPEGCPAITVQDLAIGVAATSNEVSVTDSP